MGDGQGRIVAGVFPVLIHQAVGDPDYGIVKKDNMNQPLDKTEQIVPASDVCFLMKNNPFHRGLRVILQETGGHQNRGADNTPYDGGEDLL